MTYRRQIGKKGFFTLILLLLVVAYPLLVYLHIDDVNPTWYGGVLLAVVALRFVLVGSTKRVSDWLMLTLVSVYCFLIMFFESELLVKFYPVFMSVGMGILFLASLFDAHTLIERFARAGGKIPPPQAHRYLRTLTAAWGILLLCNGAISAYTAWFTSVGAWAVYNGVISYMIFISFAAIEWGYRGYYKKRHNIVDE